MTPEDMEKKRRIWRDYKLRKKAGLTKTQEQAERESMAILRANQAAEAARKRDEAARQKRDKEKRAAEELVAQTELETLNRVCGTSFCYGQCVLVTCGRRARVKGATPSRLLVHLFSGEVLLVSPHDVWSMVELSKQAVFEFEEAPGKISKSGSVDGAGRVRHMVAPGGYV